MYHRIGIFFGSGSAFRPVDPDPGPLKYVAKMVPTSYKCCGSRTFFFGILGKVSDPDLNPDPDLDHTWRSFKINVCTKFYVLKSPLSS